MPRFLQELKRRKVIRVAAAYGAVAFVLIQAASYVFPALLLPDVAFRVLVVLSLFGFPIALVLAWAFEVTPDGVRRTSPAGEAEGAAEGADASGADAGAGEDRAPGRDRRRFGYGHLAAVFAAGLLVSVGVFGLTDPLSRGGTGAAGADDGDGGRDRVVVVPFRFRSAADSLDPVGTMAADWIAEGLNRTGVARVVPMGTASAAARAVGSETGGALPPDRVAERTGAGLVVGGDVYRRGDSLHFQAEIVDPGSGNVLHSLGPATAPASAPMPGIEEIRQRVLGALATEFDSLDVASALRRDPPPYEAYRLYTLGMDAFLEDDMEGAVRYFRRAHGRDSTFVLPLAKAVAAYLNLGREAAADSLVRRIGTASDPADLRPFTRAMVEYRRAQVSGTRREVYATSKELARLAPGSVWSYVVGRHALCRGRVEEAARVLSSADTALELGATRRGALLAELAVARHLQGEFRRELAIVRELHYAAAPPGGTGAPPTVVFDSTVDAHVGRLHDRVRPLAALGRQDRLREIVDQRLGLPADAEPTPGEFLTLIGRELTTHGHGEAAPEFHDRAVEWHRERPPSQRDDPRQLRDLAWALYAAGRFEEALPVYRRLVEMGEGSGDGIAASYLTRNRGRVGMLAAALGDTGTARRVARRLASDSLPRGDAAPFELGFTLYARAGIAAQLGERERATSLLRRARKRGCWGRTIHHLDGDPVFEPLQDDPEFRELVS